jgi:hypothetical protein
MLLLFDVRYTPINGEGKRLPCPTEGISFQEVKFLISQIPEDTLWRYRITAWTPGNLQEDGRSVEELYSWDARSSREKFRSYHEFMTFIINEFRVYME